jgi:perosamine synthetase
MPSEIPIAHVDIRPEDIEAVSRVLASGNLRQGRVVAEFEEAFAQRVGAAHAVAVSSGTAALHLAYLGLFHPGDEVIVPAFTFVATASMLVAVGAVPVFADVDPGTFTLSVDDACSRVNERTRGIAGVHLFGNACEISPLLDLAQRRGLSMVWDAAQALGTGYRGRDVGGYDQAVCYSFYPTKNITTGEGGMVVTDDGDLAKLLRVTRSQGAEAKYRHTILGFNYRMTDFQAALGLQQLARLDNYLDRRRENAQEYDRALEGIDGLQVPATPSDTFHTYNQYGVRLNSAMINREEIVTRLAGQGIETAIHYPRPLHLQPMFGPHPPELSPLDESEQLCHDILCLPVHPGIPVSQVRKVASALCAAILGHDHRGYIAK